MNWTEFLVLEQASRDTIDVKRVYIDMADDLVAGIALSQLIYWHLPTKTGESKLKVERDGHQWLAKKREDWWDECRISPKQIDRAFKILEGKGLIEKAHFRFDGLRMLHVRIIQEKFLAQLGAVLKAQKEAAQLSKEELRSSPLGNSAVDQKVRPLTKTPPKTTQEIVKGKPIGFPTDKTTVEKFPKKKPKNKGDPRVAELLHLYGLELPSPMTNHGEEAKAAKGLIRDGRKPYDVMRCYRYYKSDPFWKDKHLKLQWIRTNFGAWVDAGQPMQWGTNKINPLSMTEAESHEYWAKVKEEDEANAIEEAAEREKARADMQEAKAAVALRQRLKAEGKPYEKTELEKRRDMFRERKRVLAEQRRSGEDSKGVDDSQEAQALR